MERCASPYDGEKLTALNLAQKILDAHGLRWADVLQAEAASEVAVGAPPPCAK
jgi:hypothetical protein